MTDKIIGRIEDREERGILEFVRHTIAANLAHRPRESEWHTPSVDVAVDVERLFASVELLIGRDSQPWSPFVATWHAGLEAFATSDDPFNTRFFTIGSLERAFGQLSGRSGSYGSQASPRHVADAIADYVDKAISRVQKGDVNRLLESARGQMLRSLFDILSIEDPAQVAYLSPLIDLARKQGNLTIATLNYDRSIENAAEVAGVACDTGIETWLTSGTLLWPDQDLRLLKLHGSIDWVYEPHTRNRELPLQHIRKVAGADEKAHYDAPAIVFGEAGKLRSEGPFLELLLGWSTELARADHLLVVGYSFRDAHVNEMIARWFNGKPERRIVVLDPRELTSEGRDSFGVHLMYVDEPVPPDKPRNTRPRVAHIAARTAESLAAAIEEALLPVGTSR